LSTSLLAGVTPTGRASPKPARAPRQYQLAEPENRMVARQLEKDWEAALAARQQLTEDYQRFIAASGPMVRGCSSPSRL
jgi:hypothetical protein